MNQTRFPPGWDEERVKRVLDYYEEQSEEAVTEDEEALDDQTQTVMDVPKELVPIVRALIAKQQGKKKTLTQHHIVLPDNFASNSSRGMDRSMNLVATQQQIESNLDRLERYRNSSDSSDREFYNELLARGICFVVQERGDRFVFGPSRFVGYAANDRERHLANHQKHGGKTNPAIEAVLGGPPEIDPVLEEEYERLCRERGFEPPREGAFGNPRKYWRFP